MDNMFKRKKCGNCGEGIKDSYRYCPNCGIELKKMIETPFEDVAKELEKMNKVFGFGFSKISFRPSKDGVNIVITSGTEEYENAETGLKREFDVKPREERKPVRIPKVTVEPETKIERAGNKQTIIIKLPGVKSMEDVEVKRLEQSIEIKAFAGDKAYFKLIPIPSNALISKEFDNNTLKIEVQR